MNGIIGKKMGMTSVFDKDGKNIPVTVIDASPNVVTQVKNVEKDGYDSVQLAYEDRKAKNVSQAMQGHFKKAGTTPKRKLASLIFLSWARHLEILFLLMRFLKKETSSML